MVEKNPISFLHIFLFLLSFRLPIWFSFFALPLYFVGTKTDFQFCMINFRTVDSSFGMFMQFHSADAIEAGASTVPMKWKYAIRMDSTKLKLSKHKVHTLRQCIEIYIICISMCINFAISHMHENTDGICVNEQCKTIFDNKLKSVCNNWSRICA